MRDDRLGLVTRFVTTFEGKSSLLPLEKSILSFAQPALVPAPRKRLVRFFRPRFAPSPGPPA